MNKNSPRLFLQFLYKFIVNRLKFKKAMADNIVVEQRLNKCSGCPYNIKGTCIACGCNVKLKAKFQDSECPMCQWEK